MNKDSKRLHRIYSVAPYLSDREGRVPMKTWAMEMAKKGGSGPPGWAAQWIKRKRRDA